MVGDLGKSLWLREIIDSVHREKRPLGHIIWVCVLTQEKTHQIEEKEVKILHPITYMSGLFRGS